MWRIAFFVALATSFCGAFTVIQSSLGGRHCSSTIFRTQQGSVKPLSVATPAQTETKNKKPTDENKALAILLRQTENFLTGSSLVYLYAELRLLSYTGYTKTPFDEIDCNKWAGTGVNGRINDTQGFTALRLLEIFLREGEWVVRTMGKLKPRDYNTLRLLKDALIDLVDLEEPDTGSRRAKDLKSLQKQIKKVIEQDGLIEQAEAVRAPTELDENLLVKAFKVVVKFVLSKKPKNEFPEAGNKKLVELTRAFYEAYVVKGSLLKKILMDDLELIYFSDRYPEMDCVYGIVLNRRAKRVGVTFRGSVNLDDWVSNLQTEQIEVPNPAISETENQPEQMGLHFGFHAYLTREWQNQKREDGKPSNRLERIIDRVEEYMEDGWTLTVSGHSRGGALATLFGFYAASGDRVRADERPVEVISFASPFVGDYRFRKAFKGLERNGKIVHARIVNKDDFGTMVPFFPVGEFVDNLDDVMFRFQKWKFNWYRHVGLQIIVAKNKKVFVDYPFQETFTAEILRTLRSNMVFSLPTVLDALENHGLVSYEKNLVDGIKEQGSDTSLDLMLKDYYAKHKISQR